MQVPVRQVADDLRGRLRLGPVSGLGGAAVVDVGRVVAVNM